MKVAIAVLFVLAASYTEVGAEDLMQMAQDPALSPDGSTVAFAWRGDLWTAPSSGGTARPLTQNSGSDRRPRYSPDGSQIAFVSDRGAGLQVYVMPSAGGAPRQVTFHSSGSVLQEWYADGQGLLTLGPRDHYWHHADRFFRVETAARSAEQLLFDDYGADGTIAPNGRRMLFVREGVSWWRKGYRGAQASQIWSHDFETGKFSRLLADRQGGVAWPMWKPSSAAFYYVDGSDGVGNLWESPVGKGSPKQLTKFTDDGVVFPSISRDGSTIIFRRLFDLYVYQPQKDESPRRIELRCGGDSLVEPRQHVTLQQATEVAFSSDGLEIAFIAGGDLWVMDTELREPKQVTYTPEPERSPAFSPDTSALLFISDRDGQSDIWRAQPANPKRFWWHNDQFAITRLTNDVEIESDLKWSRDGRRVAFVRGVGDLWTMSPDGSGPRRVIGSFLPPDYQWSPDGQWFAVSRPDEDFNFDIWLVRTDGSGEPYNLSRHPDNDGDPAWSPDGRLLAFTGRRRGEETDIYYAWLRRGDEETDARERADRRATEKIQNARRRPSAAGTPATGTATTGTATTGTPTAVTPAPAATTSPSNPPATAARPAATIDFDGLADRLHRVTNSGVTETGLVFSPDSSKLAFTASSSKGRQGTYTIGIPESLTPAQLSPQSGTQPRWIASGNQLVWLADGVPSSLSSTGKAASYRFTALQSVDRVGRQRAIFDLCWRTMRDRYYDARLGNRDWDAVRAKYRDAAARAADPSALSAVVQMMLGELNGSHLGFSPQVAASSSAGWREATAHLGVRFARDHAAAGLRIKDVLPHGPADHVRSRLFPGDLITHVHGREIPASIDPTRIFNGPPGREFVLRVRGIDGKQREVTLRSISFGQAGNLLYEKWIDDNRRHVDNASQGRLGYLHVARMDEASFLDFEEALVAAGAGKQGLIIDVRENGGGSTTDHLLTVLTQPAHAVTVARGGAPGYPQDRRVYAVWQKPIVVVCNQNSFSNAEVFSHAIQVLKRGKLVGTPTAGAVISTGAANIMDAGILRLPFRGWFVLDTGEDMELNGAEPDVEVWPEPGQMPQGNDVQLDRAVDVLSGEVREWESRPRPKLRKASERP